MEGIVVTNMVEEEVRKAALQFYQALDDLLLNKGVDSMNETWHHEDCTSTVHPFGHWASGWDEVWACWQESAAVFSYYHGHKDRQDGIGTIHDLRVTVVGDMAFTIGVYKSMMYFPDHPRPLSVNCTDVFLKRNGEWKIVHHHADQAPPDYQNALARMLEA